MRLKKKKNSSLTIQISDGNLFFCLWKTQIQYIYSFLYFVLYIPE
jgi:hypothetical protein